MKSLLAILLSATAVAAATPSNINWLNTTEPEPKEEEVQEEQVTPLILEWTAKGFTENEMTTLKFLQEQGITDKMAIAVVMGNIKQESNFNPNICEGGARIPYGQCHRGGYGLVQWTTSFRYWGLGNHAKSIGGDPSSLETQLSYMVTEVEWKNAAQMFKNPNQSKDYYMRGADIWLGWGIYGNRGYYSQDYYNRLS